MLPPSTARVAALVHLLKEEFQQGATLPAQSDASQHHGLPVTWSWPPATSLRTREAGAAAPSPVGLFHEVELYMSQLRGNLQAASSYEQQSALSRLACEQMEAWLQEQREQRENLQHLQRLQQLQQMQQIAQMQRQVEQLAPQLQQIQEVINNGLFPPVIHLLQTGDFDIKKEAAWAISNATSGGSAQQIEYLVEQGCINPLVDLLTVSDAKIIGVALEALENILKVGKDKQQENGLADNPVATRVEQADGLQKIEALQEDPNEDVYQKAMKILENYFPLEDDDADIGEDAGANQFQFGAQVPTGGFSFGS